MSKIDYQALREKAEKATSGVWSLEYGEERFDAGDALIHREVVGYLPICRIEGAHPESGFDEDFQMEQQANAEFIAAANPATVLALLDELEAADNNLIDSECHVAELEEALRDKQALLEASEKRIAELEAQEVVPDEMTPKQASLSYCGEVRGYRDGWNDCRAAMLQSGNFREIAETSTNSPVIPSEVLSAILKVAKIRADFDDFDGDRRGIGDCLDDAEQELIVTINKYASQLAAEPIATNDVREQTAVPPVPVIQADVAKAIEKLKRKLVECNRYNYCADAVNGVEYACYAAMLQDDEPATDNTNQQFESLAKSK